jgi:hypothetical protein
LLSPLTRENCPYLPPPRAPNSGPSQGWGFFLPIYLSKISINTSSEDIYVKAKTIRKVLRKKVDDWLATIPDPNVRNLLKRDTIITGGCIVSMLLKEKVSDYDVYFKTTDAAKAAATHYLNMFKELHPDKTFLGHAKVIRDDDRVRIFVQSEGVLESDPERDPDIEPEEPEMVPIGQEMAINTIAEHVPDPNNPESFDVEDMDEIPQDARLVDLKYRPVFMTSNAITLSDGIQLVIRFTGDPAEIHKNFDFAHCFSYWTSEDNNLVLNPESLECILAKELRYKGSRYPLCSVIRTRKFLKRDWNINAGQYVKMCLQISNLDLTNMEVLEDQLIGVDAAYFMAIISHLKRQQNTDDPKPIETSYLIEVLDRVFQ